MTRHRGHKAAESTKAHACHQHKTKLVTDSPVNTYIRLPYSLTSLLIEQHVPDSKLPCFRCGRPSCMTAEGFYYGVISEGEAIYYD